MSRIAAAPTWAIHEMIVADFESDVLSMPTGSGRAPKPDARLRLYARIILWHEQRVEGMTAAESERAMQRAIRENLGLLESCDTLLGSLAIQEYTRTTDACFDGAIGQHVRHLLDHYLGFFSALENGGNVDYEARRRDERIEWDLEFARATLREVVAQLSKLEVSELGSKLLVKIEGVGAEPVWAESSRVRELGFLVSHTVHHCALINVICRATGVIVPANFGIAPSTLRHRAGNSDSCAW